MLFWLIAPLDLHFLSRISSKLKKRDLSLPSNSVFAVWTGEPPVSNVIVMDNRTTKGPSPKAGVRDRRFAIRFPFAADVELIDLETGTQATGVTSDISLGGCFICTSKPLPLQSRVRMTLSRKGQVVKGLAVVRIVKPRIGMGIEFLDVESFSHGILSRWIDQLRQR